MNAYTNPLEHVKVAAPCSADWNRMVGDEQIRFCQQCNLNVYNLSGMTRKEAEALVTRTEGRLCVRFYRRADGSILTENCPVGLRALKRRLSRVGRATVSLLLSFLAGMVAYFGWRRTPAPVSATQGVMVQVYEEEAQPPPPYPADAVTGVLAREEPQVYVLGTFAAEENVDTSHAAKRRGAKRKR